MKQLSKNMKNLELKLRINNLGGNGENFKWLGVGMNQLPKYLQFQFLKLDLSYNSLNIGNEKKLKDDK